MGSLQPTSKSVSCAALLFAALVLIGAADAPVSPVAYFERARSVKVSDPEKQNYAILDEAVWQHSRADLGDLRLYTNDNPQQEIPYAIVAQNGTSRTELSSVPVLNKGVVRGNTQFSVDVGIPEYDNVHLDIATKDYIAQAKLEGEDNLSGKNWSDLGTYTIFDFTKEKLGSSSNIRLATPARFRFLRVTIIGPVPPDELKGASIANLQESKTRYTALSAMPSIRQEGQKTIVEWNQSDRVPLDRIHFEIDPAEVNFRRNASVRCDDRIITNDVLTRIRMVRKDRKIESENLDLRLAGLRCNRYKVEIQNGDDPALHITAVRPEMLEHRIYFNPRGQRELTLFYGDEKRSAPVYDYAKFFESPESKDQAEATLQPDSANSAFIERPDDRPWSDRHPAVLWVTMIAAIALLGVWALKGFKA